MLLRSPSSHVAASGDNLPRFSRAKPLAASLGLSVRTLFRWSEKGFISRYRVNARVTLFQVDEVNTYVKAARV